MSETWREWLAGADDDMETIQRIVDPLLKGKLGRHWTGDSITVSLSDLLAVTCIAASVQQCVRAAFDSAPTPTDPTP